MLSTELKNQIKASLLATRMKRKTQICRTVELKINLQGLSKMEIYQLDMFFIEAKWLYNYIISLNKEIFNFDSKTTKIKILNKNRELEDKELKFLPAYLRRDIFNDIKQNICNLSKKKKKGIKVGFTKFRSKITCISLSNNAKDGGSHYIVGDRIKIVGIKRHLRLFGIGQIKPEYETANAKLIKRPTGYYVKLTCFENIKLESFSNLKADIGVDFGIKNMLTTSDGEILDVCIAESMKLKKLQRKLSRQIKNSTNYNETKLKIQKEHEKLQNQKRESSNKIVHHLCIHNRVYIQNDNFSGWQQRWGKKLRSMVLGIIKQKLLQRKNVVVIDRFVPTTKFCYNCGKINKNLTLSDRIFKCDCGFEMDRDLKAAKTIMYFGKCDSYVPQGMREFTPVEKQAAALTCSHVNVSYISQKQERIA